MRAPFVLSIVFAVALGTGCSAKHDCRTDGQACAETADCCDELACFDGACGVPVLACPDEAPVDCGAALPGQCCPMDAPFCCARDSSCYARASDCTGLSCSGALKNCATSASCCSGLACARFGRTCNVAKNLVTGDACTASTQCASRWCNAYCTRRCTKTSECGSANNCLESANGLLCIPFCSTNADCAVFGPGITCQKALDPNGLSLSGCFAK